MKTATSFLEKLKAFKFQLTNKAEWVINLTIAEEIVHELGTKVDEFLAKLHNRDSEITTLKEQIQTAKTEESKFYQEEKRVLEAKEICRKCEHMINGNCKFHAICKSVAVDYYQAKKKQ